MTIREKLEFIMLYRGWGTTEIAKWISVTPRAIYNWLKGASIRDDRIEFPFPWYSYQRK